MESCRCDYSQMVVKKINDINVLKIINILNFCITIINNIIFD